MDMLHKIDTTGYTKPKVWCGPGALSILTGAPLTEATARVTRINGGTYDETSGAWAEEVLLALHEYGKTARQIDIAGRYPESTHGPTLARFMQEREPAEVMAPLLIEVSGHFLTAHMGYAADNWTMRPVAFGQFPKPKRLVKAAWRIT